MCSTCGAKTYGQHQPEARAKDLEKLEKVRKRRETVAARKEASKYN